MNCTMMHGSTNVKMMGVSVGKGGTAIKDHFNINLFFP